jgi:hypothetical protein
MFRQMRKAGAFQNALYETPSHSLYAAARRMEEKRELALKLSPIELLRADSPAILIAPGDADQVLSDHNAIAMHNAAQAMASAAIRSRPPFLK